MLKTIAGVLKPTKGSVTVNGSIAPLIELGAGFDMDLTARENVFLNGALLGYSRKQMQEYYDDIVEFSELKDLMDVPVKNFSSGMVSRLSFAIATIGTPDILIVDEVLSVGDFRFQEKCEQRIQKMMNGETTILFVSHNINQVEKLCNKIVWLEKGVVKAFGDAKEIADEYGLWILEDACHAPGGYFVDRSGERQYCGNGRFANAGVFSFHPVKHIATGEGGMVTTNDEELYKKLCLYRTHGITKDPTSLHENHGGWYYEMQQLGFNYRMTDFQAALGISQMSRADAGLARRQEIANRYDEAFQDIQGIKIPYRAGNVYHAFHLYVIQVEDRLGLYNYLRENKILAQVHYVPVHLQPYYRKLGSKEGDCPEAEEYYGHCLSLPMFPTLTDEEQGFVIDKVLEFVKKK